jgi:hypothetical protein
LQQVGQQNRFVPIIMLGKICSGDVSLAIHMARVKGEGAEVHVAAVELAVEVQGGEACGGTITGLTFDGGL